MKYFTAQLWADINSTHRNTATKEWDENVEKYREELKAILPRLNAHARQFFRDVSLHDGTLACMEVGDRIDDRERYWERGDINRRKAGLRLHVVSAEGDCVFRLEYKEVTRVELSFPGEILFPAGRWPNFGDWGYDELGEVGNGVFRHEVLFASGATILVEFTKFAFSKTPAKGKAARRKRSSR